MAHFRFRNVNDAFVGLVSLYANKEEANAYGVEISRSESRNGPVLQIMEPVIITYEKPCERVLFNQARDVNPFFTLYESLWMLAGRNDIDALAYYTPNMKNYSDDGKTQNGAYGYRWRHAAMSASNPGIPNQFGEGIDQLKIIIEHLKLNPTSRRVVLQMWNVEDDLMKIGTPVGYSKDVCCNVCVMFSIRNEEFVGGGAECFSYTVPKLDMTVINRSNDLVWGMLGANYVHFSFLQEYVAANLGVEVGVYNQMSNNLHIYTESNSGFKHEEWSKDGTQDVYVQPIDTTTEANKEFKTCSPAKLIPLIKDPIIFEEELHKFLNNVTDHSYGFHAIYSEPFFNTVASPMLWAFELHKKRQYGMALNTLKGCNADDWRIAGTNWIMKRKLNWEAKQRGDVNAQAIQGE